MATSQGTLPPLPKYLVEDELTQECRDLMSSLPTEKALLTSYYYQYQGFWHTSRQLQGVVGCQQHFQAQDTDVLLVTTPKSGTTWLKAILFALLNRGLYPDYTQHHPLLTDNPHVLVPFLELGLYVDANIPDLTHLHSPRLLSTHLPWVSLPKSARDSACKLVYLCRNPKDTFVSIWHFTNKLRVMEQGGAKSIEDVFDRFCRGVSLYGPFWDHVLGYWKESLEKPQKVLFLKYEEMKEKPNVNLKRVAEFLECPFSPEEESKGAVDEMLRLCSFQNLSNLEVNKSGQLASGEENRAFFRKGEVGDWKNHLSPEMANRLDQITKEKLCGSGLKF